MAAHSRIALAAAFVLSPALSFAAISLLSPANGATDVSQSPALNAAELLPGASVQYHFQVDTLQTMDSQGGGPQGSFDQTAAQLFASSGAFFIVPVKPFTSPRRKPGSSVVEIYGFRLSPE